MNNFLKKTFLIVCILFTYSCGFKVLDNSSLSNFSIKQIETVGDTRINYQIKNQLVLIVSKDNVSFISINLNTKKNKSVKEKNIKNEIVKYQIEIKTNLDFTTSLDSKTHSMQLVEIGDYITTASYSTTLDNEKKLIDNLTKKLTQRIQNKISMTLNDL